ncbi:MAG: hypothetical protein ACYTGK_11890 [Planctomycetota bacterium]
MKLAKRCAEVSHCATVSGWQRRQVSAPIVVPAANPSFSTSLRMRSKSPRSSRVMMRAGKNPPESVVVLAG